LKFQKNHIQICNPGTGFLLVLLLLIVCLSYSCQYTGNANVVQPPEANDTAAIPFKLPTLTFGIPSDSFNIVKDHVRRNAFLSDILEEYGVTRQEIEKVTSNSKDVFDVKKIRAGNNYTVMTDNDSIARLRYFIYEHDPLEYYIFSFNDSLNITPFHYKARSEIFFASGTIETSLWDAMIGNGMNPELAVDLSEIFAWTVDFFGLQKGDRFKIIYEEKFVGDKSVEIGKIYGAEFISSGIPILAIPLIQDGEESFYDADGNSLRKAFLKAPLRFSRISSRYSSGRMHPILRIVRPHFGVDYAAPVGTPVHSVGDGKVTSVANEGQAGRMVRIRHNSVYSTAYLHLSRYGKGIVPGAVVKQGQIVGYVGTSGLSTGPHLDFRFYKNGYPVDPLKVKAPPVEPVHEDNMAKFEKIKTVTLDLLGSFN
jgi:murein DD-endopeptidase MepM/ murein hydrolase activator NlpD